MTRQQDDFYPKDKGIMMKGVALSRSTAICFCYLALLPGLSAAPAGAQNLYASVSADLSPASGSLAAPDLGPDRVVRYSAGETIDFFAVSATALEDSRVLQMVSTEFVSLVVLAGHIRSGNKRVLAGEVLVMPIAEGKVQKFTFDAQALRQSFQAAEVSDPDIDFDALIAKQKRQCFWGRLVPLGINVAAPVSPQAETFRRTYLSLPIIVQLRQRAGNDRAKLLQLTAEAFLSAYEVRDDRTLAALMDPVPFIEVSRDPVVWKRARLAFANRVIADRSLSHLVTAPVLQAVSPDSFTVNQRATLTLVNRDSAIFVTSFKANP
jgi:hypothetical protein